MKQPNAKQRILQVLCDAWPLSVPLYVLISPNIGGTCAYRRIYSLIHDHGIEIDYYYDIREGKQTHTSRYMLMPDPADVDVERLKVRTK